MGNTRSNYSFDSEQESAEDSVYETDKDQGLDTEGNLDLSILFDLQQLREVSSKIKEEGGPSLLQQHQSTLVRWIDERKSRGDETITLGQFTDFLTNREIEKDVAAEIFRQFDIEGNGVVEIDQFHEILVSSTTSNGIGFRNDLQFVNGLFQDYPYTPGFLDAFTDGKTVVSKHGKKLAKFLARNRARSNALSVPALESFTNTTDMRLRVLWAHIASMKEKAELKGREPSLQDDEVLKPITRCFTSIEVSTNRSDIAKLTDSDSRTFWQSDGPARSHWIRLKIAPNVVVRQLSVSVASSDESYMPQHVTVSAGRDIYHLVEINDVKIPAHFTGSYPLIVNMKTYYPVVQINIKRCHSDGCDTRIRQVKAIGYRVVKSKKVTIVDATATWYLSVLASTAQAALPIAPGLRDAILSHTKSALVHIQPLALSSMSSEMPGFLGDNVMEQMEKFLHNIVSMTGQSSTDDLCILLEFAIARGNLGSIMKVLKILFHRIDEEYHAVALLKNLAEVKEKSIRKHGTLLDVTVACCDGGSKEETSGPANVLRTAQNSEPYLSSNGKTKVNFAFTTSSGELMTLAKAFIKVSRGAIGADEGLIFVLDSLDVKTPTKKEDSNPGDDRFERLKEYDNWTSSDFKELSSRIKSGYEPKEEDPVAYFSLDKEWDDTDVHVDRMKSGHYVVVKFLKTRQDSAERLGINCINLFGYETEKNSIELQNTVKRYTKLPESSNEHVSGLTMFLHVLGFLDDMATDTLRVKSQNRKDQPLVEKDPLLDLNDISMPEIWELYNLASKRGFHNEDVAVACTLMLSLFRQTLSHMKSGSQKRSYDGQQSTLGQKNLNDDDNKNQASAEIFHHLCDLVDDGSAPASILNIAKCIILDGAEVFFPNAQSRREHLLSLVDQVMEEKKAVSVGYTFESLCRFFSSRDAGGLLGLPNALPCDDFNKESVVHVMHTLVSVAYRECVASITKEESQEKPTNLVQLLCTMQKCLLVWCYTNCSSKNVEAQKIANYVLLEYIRLISNKCEKVLQTLIQVENKASMVDRLENTFISVAMRQLILFLNFFSTLDIPCVELLHVLQKVNKELKALSFTVPDLFHQSTPEDWKEKQDSVILRNWDVESKHNYDNNMHAMMVFSCPGCTEFKVVFDNRCETERRYDYLEFTDSKGQKRKFDQKVGSPDWPLTIHFKAGQKLHFLFHSDGSNNEWGYKFRVSAIGRPDIAVTWIFDLQLNIAKLFGVLCSNAIDYRRALETQSEKANEGELALLHSELWSSLFRGGYRVGKLQRSLSGYYGSSPADSEVNTFLVKLINEEEHSARAFIEKCRASRTGHYLGGSSMDAAVHSVFAALVWHTQEMREQITQYLSTDLSGEVPACIMAGFTAAENVRRTLLEKRQKLCVLAEESKEGEGHKDVDMIDPDSPITACKEKSLFLLKFAGLSKLPKKAKEADTLVSRANSMHRTRSWGKHDSSEYKLARLQSENFSIYDKYPTLQMVTDFVSNEALSPARIQNLLKQRHQYANNVSNIYTFAKEFIQSTNPADFFAPHIIMFLQQFLHCQQNFPRHYCDFLNGCGLEYETIVRKNFYSYIKDYSNAVLHGTESKLFSSSSFFESVRAYLLHFLTIDWKPYDHSFLLEIELPKLLLDASKKTAYRPGDNMEQFELEMYERHNNFFKEAKSSNIESWCERSKDSASKEVKRDISLFIAKYADHLAVQITCDGCGDRLSGRRYRCLNCEDLDLCSKCYSDGEKPDGHTDDHEIIDLRYTCDQCSTFIVGTRIHCNDCTDFDLCLGCFKKQSCPGQHQLAHNTVRHTMNLSAIYSRPQDTCSLQTYVHHYSWLQFASLALSLSETLQERRGLDAEYSRAAADLLLNCLNELADVLDSIKVIPEPESTVEDETGKSGAKPKVLVRQHASDEDAEGNDNQTTDTAEMQIVVTYSSDPGQQAGDTQAAGLESPNDSGMDVDNALSVENRDTRSDVTVTADNVVEETTLLEAQGDSVKTETVVGTEKPGDAAVQSSDLFSSFAQDRILGLIGALMPPNRQLSSYPNSEKFIEFASSRLIPGILRLLRSDQPELKVRIIALGVLSKTLRCISPEVADQGVEKLLEGNQEQQGVSSAGVKTVELLFKLGAECLERADLDTASGLETLLQQLTCTGKWHSSVTQHANACLKSLAVESKNPTLPSLFALMVFAGFPDVYRMGTLAKFTETGAEPKEIVIFDYNQDRGVAWAYNFKSRKSQMIKEHLIDNNEKWSDGTDSNRIPVLLDIIKDVLSSRKGVHGSVEQKWVRALALKALLGNLKAGIGSGEMLSIMNSSIIPLVVSLACQGTRFSKHWLLRDLEILSWKLYKQVHTGIEPVKERDSKDPMDGLSKETKEAMENIFELHMVNCTYAVLRAMYENCGRDDDKLREEVQKSVVEDNGGLALRVSDEIKECAKKWESADAELKLAQSDAYVDVGVSKFAPQLKENKDIKAKPECGDTTHKFITSLTEAEKYERRGQQRRSKSAELLRLELETKQRSDTADFIKKVNHAVSVGYARHLVAWLFSLWPKAKRITKTFLNNIDASKVVGLLDLIQEAEHKEHFEKVVFNFVQLCDKELVQPLALSAVHCMGEVQLASVIIESEHKYKNNSRIEDKVSIPGAVSLFVRFDKRCATESKCDILTLSSAQNYSQNIKTYSGTSHWPECEIPGDTVFYKFTSDASNNDWGWKFTVTGGQLGRFETGCGILNGLLAQDIEFSRSLPLKQLWSWLIVVACNQVGQQRLMATGLLLRILQIAAGDPLLFGENQSPLVPDEWPDLSLLKPLWTLYTKTMGSETVKGASFTLMSPVLRGLSELFLVVENVAQDLGIADELIAKLAAEEKLQKRLTQALNNIAAIGMAIDVPNKAIDLLKNAPSCRPTDKENLKESESQSHRRSPDVIEITGNNSEWSESEDQEDDTQDENGMDIDGESSSSNDNSTFSTTEGW